MMEETITIIVDDLNEEARELADLPRQVQTKPPGFMIVSLHALAARGGLASAASKAASLLNQAAGSLSEGSFVVFLQAGERPDFAGLAQLRERIVAADADLAIARVGKADPDLSSSPAEVLARLYPPGGLSSLLIVWNRVPASLKTFAETGPIHVAKEAFARNLLIEARCLMAFDLSIATPPAGPLAGAGMEAQRASQDKFLYGGSLQITDAAQLKREIPITVAALQNLRAFTAEEELFRPYLKITRKLLGAFFRARPSMFFKLGSWMENAEPRLITRLKRLRDLGNGFIGLPRSLRAGLLLAADSAGLTSLAGMPVYINNRNRLEMMTDLIEFLEQAGFRKITIIDNDSTYPPLLEYYTRTKHRVIKLGRNVGPLALWSQDFPGKKPRGFYIYTDSDVVPSFLPGLAFVRAALQGFLRFPYVKKFGLSLKIDNLPADYPRKQAVIEHERKFWEVRRGSFYDAPVDTTFAIYGPGCAGGYWVRAFRMASPWVAEHRPWYISPANLSENERFYTATAAHWASWKREP